VWIVVVKIVTTKPKGPQEETQTRAFCQKGVGRGSRWDAVQVTQQKKKNIKVLFEGNITRLPEIGVALSVPLRRKVEGLGGDDSLKGKRLKGSKNRTQKNLSWKQYELGEN